MVVILTNLGLVVAGISWKNQQAEMIVMVLAEVVAGSQDLLSWVTRRS